MPSQSNFRLFQSTLQTPQPSDINNLFISEFPCRLTWRIISGLLGTSARVTRWTTSPVSFVLRTCRERRRTFPCKPPPFHRSNRSYPCRWMLSSSLNQTASHKPGRSAPGHKSRSSLDPSTLGPDTPGCRRCLPPLSSQNIFRPRAWQDRCRRPGHQM